MVKVYSKALNDTVEVNRLIGHIKGEQSGPVVIFLGGIHGNEPSGVFALAKTMKRLRGLEPHIRGDIYALSGNMKALSKGQRFLSYDLNRIWRSPNIELIESDEESFPKDEFEEAKSLYRLTTKILKSHTGPFYFVDLHTTSGETTPFLTLNDTILNRKFCSGYPVPTILGIEEFIEGPFLSYINELGFVAVGFESGQHDDLSSIEFHESFFYLTLERAGVMTKGRIPDYGKHFSRLFDAAVYSNEFFEILHRFEIEDGNEFVMREGYKNFQPIAKGEHLAQYNNQEIHAKDGGKIFLPFYQKQGEDGFFIIRKIPGVALRVSAFLRKINFDNLLPLFPGVHWESVTDKRILKVDKRVARFFARDFFHLLGYRSKKIDQSYLIVRNRERSFRKSDYANEKWV